jgi:hypothetical protein
MGMDDVYKSNVSHLFVAIIATQVLLACTSALPGDGVRGVQNEYSQYVTLVEERASLEELSDHWTDSARQMLYGTPGKDGQPVSLESFRAALEHPQLFTRPAPDEVTVTDMGGIENVCGFMGSLRVVVCWLFTSSSGWSVTDGYMMKYMLNIRMKMIASRSNQTVSFPLQLPNVRF